MKLPLYNKSNGVYQFTIEKRGFGVGRCVAGPCLCFTLKIDNDIVVTLIILSQISYLCCNMLYVIAPLPCFNN